MERLRCWKINGSQFNIIQYKFLPILILIFSVCGINGDVTLSVDPAMSRGRPSFITCTTTNQITAGVEFSKDNAASQGTCYLPGGPCESTIPGYSVTQDVSTRTTTLRIDSVSCTRETGSWYCQHGGDPRSPTVYIGCNTTKYSPSIDKSQFPSTYTVIAGRQLNINCASYTTPGRPSDTSYTWTHPDGSTTSGSTLNINSIDSNQSGQFTCTASNIFSSTQQGQDSATVQVQVQFPPRVSGQDSSYPVVESSPLHINCSSYTTPGNPSTTIYRWTGPDSYTSTGPVLSISSISRTQTGQYNCTASNTLTPTGGPPQTETDLGQFLVDVQYLLITSFTINSNTNFVTVNESDHVTIRCQVDSNPGSTIRLLNGSSELSSADNSFIEFSWTAACRQRGNYSCVATSNIDDIGIISKSVHLIVKCSPRLDVPPKKEITAAVGDNTTLTVTLLSYPEPSITWRKTNNTSLRNLTSISSVTKGSDISVTASLTLTEVKEDDFGEYFLQADNGFGKAARFTVSLVAEGSYQQTTGVSPTSAGLVGGTVAGVVIVVIIVVVVVVVFRRRRNKGDDKEHITKTTTVTGTRQVTNENDSTDMPVYAVVEKRKKSTDQDEGLFH